MFVDSELVAVVDTTAIPSNGSAIWAKINMNQGAHLVQVAGVDGDSLNLLIDYFRLVFRFIRKCHTQAPTSINGAVTSTGSGSDSGYIPPEKLTPIIVGSVLGFLALLAIIALCVFCRLRRKKQVKIRKSGIKLMKIDESNIPTNGMREAKDGRPQQDGRNGFLSGFLPRRQGTFGFGRGSRSSDGLSPFLPSNSHASTGSYPTAGTNSITPYSPPVPNSPPTSADPLVPLFTRPGSPPRRQKSQGPAHPGALPAAGASTSTLGSLPNRRQDKQAATAAAAAAATAVAAPRPSHQRNNDSYGSRQSEDAPLMEPRPKLPPAYDQAHPRPQPQPVRQDTTSSTMTNQPPWSATTASTIPATTTTTTSQSSQYPPEKASYMRSNTTNVPSSPPPSFLEIDATPRLPVAPAAAATPMGMQRNVPVQQAKSLKGPRPRDGRDGSSPRPSVEGQRSGQGMRLDEWNRLGGVRVGSNASLGRREQDLPESPIDPAVQWS